MVIGTRRVLGAVGGAAVAALVASTALSPLQPVASSPTAHTRGPAVWARHAARYDGALSQRLADVLAPPAVVGTGADRARPRTARVTARHGRDQQVNIDSEPPVTQSNPSLAVSLRDPLNAVASMNDRVGRAFQIVRTRDGGRTWHAVREGPATPAGWACNGIDNAVAYSRRDGAFYLTTSCLTSDGASAVGLWRSVDGGETWTSPYYGATITSNLDPTTGTPDPSYLYTWNSIAVDNGRRSPTYGRIYVGYVKFHLLDSGESDYCPAQVAWTDDVPLVPRAAHFTITPLAPDGGTPHGSGPATAAWNRMAVGPGGTVFALYAQEGCNTSVDEHLRVARSYDGGATFETPRAIDAPGDFVDNPDTGDVLPDKEAALGLSTSLAINRRTGTILVGYQNNVTAASTGADVWVSRSTDDGDSWTADPVAMHGGRPAARDQFHLSLAAGPDGTWHALWLDDRRDQGNHLVEAWSAVSRDDGRTWRGRPQSSRSYDPDGTDSSGGSTLGNQTSVAVSSARTYLMWPDGRDNDVSRTGIGDLDVWAATSWR